MQYEEILGRLEALSNPEAADGMARYGISTKSARWIASDALRELTSEAVQERLRQRL